MAEHFVYKNPRVVYKTDHARPHSGEKFSTWNHKGVEHFPPLFQMAVTGKMRFWIIACKDACFMTEYGEVNGTTVSSQWSKCEAKNVGRSNSSTPEEQALSEAYSKWMKKQDRERYYLSRSEAKQNATKVAPMLAHVMTEKKFDTIVAKNGYVCVSEKLDGVRGFVTIEEGKAVITSRTFKQFNFLTRLKRELAALEPEYLLDGELYIHEKVGFNSIISIVKQVTAPSAYEDSIEFWVYDIVDDELSLPYLERAKILRKLEKRAKERGLERIKFHLFQKCDNIPQLDEMLSDALLNKYEGLMIRDPAAPYMSNRRTNALLKYKNFTDEEMKIVGVKDGKGQEKGLAIFVVQYDSKQTIEVRPRGDRSQRKEWFDNPKDCIGKNLTVRYQPSNEKVLPRFPVGICIRDYE